MMGVYFIQSKYKPNRIYVGSSTDISIRFKVHKSYLQNKKHHNTKMQNHCNKYGFDDLEFIPMVIGVKPEELIQLEQDCLDVFKPYFNILKTAWSVRGYKHTIKTRRKISESELGEKNHNYGKPLTEKHRQKISKALIGRSLSDETKQKISNSGRGRVVSAETKQKMSKWQRGENNHRYDHAIYHFYHPKHGERICTQHELRREWNLLRSNLSFLLKGKRKTSEGWILIK